MKGYMILAGGLYLQLATATPITALSSIFQQKRGTKSSTRSEIMSREVTKYNRECNAPGYGPFACVTCDDTTIRDITQPIDARWTAADGDAAWDQIKKWWTVLRGGSGGAINAITGFVPTIAWYYEGPQQWDCANIGESFCSAPVDCPDAQIPAGAMILTSFANIHVFYDNFYTAIQNAGNNIQYSISGFADTFAPQDKSTVDVLKILIDVFGLSYGLLGAGVWNKILRDSPIFKNRANDHAWAKDSANAAVASSVILAKDAKSTVAGKVSTQNDLMVILGEFVKGWSEVTATYLKNLFRGEDDDLAQLDPYIKAGAWADPAGESSLFDITQIMENVLYGSMIPQAWKDRPDVHPVLVFQQGTGIDNPLTTILKDTASSTLSNEDALKSRTEYSGTSLWLLDAHDCTIEEAENKNGPGGCRSPFVQALPGIGALNGKDWGGVVVDDITISSYNGFRINGEKNGYVMPEDSRFQEISEDAPYPFAVGIRTPGFFSIPVCSIDTVFDVTVRQGHNKGPNNRCPTYPCC